MAQSRDPGQHPATVILSFMPRIATSVAPTSIVIPAEAGIHGNKSAHSRALSAQDEPRLPFC